MPRMYQARRRCWNNWQCNVCKQWHVEGNFPMKHRQRQCSFYRVCLTCEIKKTCVTCKVPKPESDFGAAAWKARHVDRRICRACPDRVRGCWTCSACGTRLPNEDFSAWQRRRAYAENGTQTCNYCFQSLTMCFVVLNARGSGCGLCEKNCSAKKRNKFLTKSEQTFAQ